MPPELEGDLGSNAPVDDETDDPQVSLPARSLKALADAGSKFPLNSADPRASNRELRAREAEEDRALIAQAQAGDPNSVTDAAVRASAFRKLVERSGIKKEMRRKEYYEKPSETRRRARLRSERRARRSQGIL